MFQVTADEVNRSQFVTGSQKHRDPRQLPYAFTEQGVAMLSSVLKSTRAVQVNIAIMRTFVRLRQMLETHRDLAEKLQTLEQKYDKQFRGGLGDPGPTHGNAARARAAEAPHRIRRLSFRLTDIVI
jgi:hypothetical protein